MASAAVLGEWSARCGARHGEPDDERAVPCGFLSPRQPASAAHQTALVAWPQASMRQGIAGAPVEAATTYLVVRGDTVMQADAVVKARVPADVKYRAMDALEQMGLSRFRLDPPDLPPGC